VRNLSEVFLVSLKQGFARGMQLGCSPPPSGKIFPVKNLKGGTKIKIYSFDFLRNLKENLKGGPKDILT
jgi:hypothetical protein